MRVVACPADAVQAWSLESLGNWRSLVEDMPGGASPDLVQTRAHNLANEIDTDNTHGDVGDAIAGTGANWVDPIHDAAGNMVKAPRPGDEATAANALLIVYDAWNRPVEISDAGTETLIVTYEYDGLHRRIEAVDKTGESDVTYDFYYNTSWQVVEVHEGGDTTNPLKQFIWDQRYVDSPIVRLRDEGTDGSIDDTLYYLNDANFNVVALIDASSGTVVERYIYTPYGERTAIDDDYSTHHEDSVLGSYDNQRGFQGLAFDPLTGLVDQRTRPWHTTLGRFMIHDKAGYPDGYNAYAGYHVMRGQFDPSGRFIGPAIVFYLAVNGIDYLAIRENALNAEAALLSNMDDLVHESMIPVYNALLRVSSRTGADFSRDTLKHWRTGNGELLRIDDRVDYILGSKNVRRKLREGLEENGWLPNDRGTFNMVGRGSEIVKHFAPRNSNPFSRDFDIYMALAEFRMLVLAARYCKNSDGTITLTGQFIIIDKFEWDIGDTTHLPGGVTLYDDAWLIMEKREPRAQPYLIFGSSQAKKKIELPAKD